MNKEDYTKVIEETHLSNGLVWSIPITLPVTESEADKPENRMILLYMAKMVSYMERLN